MSLASDVRIQLADCEELLQRMNYFIAGIEVPELISLSEEENIKEIFEEIEDKFGELCYQFLLLNDLLIEESNNQYEDCI